MSKLQKRYYKAYKLLCVFGILLLASHFHVAAASMFLDHDTDAMVNPVAIGATNFSEISPMMDMYAYWDTLNLNPYAIDFSNITGSIHLSLAPQDCGFVLPVAGAISSPFGYRWGRPHEGVDLTIKMGDSVYCAFDGVVRMSRWYYGYGNCVVVRHHNGMETLYGHLSNRAVKPGQMINAGQLIGLGGSTGYSTGPHLHFETRFLGKPVDPQSIIDFKADSLKRDTLSFQSKDFVVPKAVAPAKPAVAKRTGYYYGYKKPVANRYYKPAPKKAATPYKAVPKTTAKPVVKPAPAKAGVAKPTVKTSVVRPATKPALKTAPVKAPVKATPKKTTTTAKH